MYSFTTLDALKEKHFLFNQNKRKKNLMLKPITKNLYFCMDKNIRKQYYQIDKQYFSFHILCRHSCAFISAYVSHSQPRIVTTTNLPFSL